ncbi:ABC transporter substrate-binding protein [Candidatus Rariloculus sp.]|uniref:ABC transporter substrate-binding protein n=1 Tax=Candidatus Rariloculus sp. TaxID=3101265 RepID=UPI003D0B2755
MPRTRWIIGLATPHARLLRGPAGACMTLILAAATAACGIDPQSPGAAGPRPQRIVSLDYCADQYVLKFVERDRILAVSPDAGRRFSYMREHAAGLPRVRPVAEDVLILKPDLVVRAYGGGPQASALFERAGVPVYNVGWAEDFDSILTVITETALALGSPEHGLAVAAEMQDRLAALRAQAPGADALYVTPTGVTSGPGSLVHEMLTAAGLDNFQMRPGWGPIPLERLAYEKPDLVAAAFFENLPSGPHAWSPIRHPVARAQLDGGAVVPIEGAWTACGAWFLMDAVEALARGPGATPEIQRAQSRPSEQ